MKCPMIINRDHNNDCIQKVCAWWNSDSETCAILQLSKDLYRIEDYVRKMKEE